MLLRAMALRFACALGTAALFGTAHADSIPERCAGYGALQSFSLTTWESGLGSWAAATQNVANPATFNTPNWSTAGNLPDGRAGNAAFVPNLVLGNCATDDESGLLTLTSPTIAIPAGTQVPRISINHWFQIEQGWDGGVFRISVNGGRDVVG